MQNKIKLFYSTSIINISLEHSGYDIYLVAEFVKSCQTRVTNARNLINDMKERERQLNEIKTEINVNTVALREVSCKRLLNLNL